MATEETRVVLVREEDITNLLRSVNEMSNALMRQDEQLRHFGLHEDCLNVQLRASHAKRTIEKLAALKPVTIGPGTPIGESRG